MSTSLLYHGFGVVGYRYIRTDYQKGESSSQLKGRNSASGAQPVTAKM